MTVIRDMTVLEQVSFSTEFNYIQTNREIGSRFLCLL